MSKNFELMQEVLRESERDFSVAPANSAIAFPAATKTRTQSASDRVAHEECLKLVQRIFLGHPAAGRTVVFAGVDSGDGCSRLCADSARILAENTSDSVCLVEANFRSPSLGALFGTSNHKGLADALASEGGIRSFATPVNSANLWLLPAGNLGSGSTHLLNSDQLKDRVQELRNTFGYVLVDVPALNAFADAFPVARLVDGVVVVLRADSTRKEAASQALENLRQAQVEVLGAVLNRRTFPIPDFVYRRL